MPQNANAGREANLFGHRIAKIVAEELHLEFTGHSSSNQCKGPKGIGVIKSAKEGNAYIGILKTMLPRLDIIYAAIGCDKNTYQVFEVTKNKVEEFKFEPTSKKNKNQWFIKVRDIKKLRPVLKISDTGSTSAKKIMPSKVVHKKEHKQTQNIEKRIQDLFESYNNIMDELRDLKVIRSTNNPAGDYGEYLAEHKLGLIQAPKSSKGYDLTDNNGTKYQVKTRRLTRHNKSRQLGGFRDLDEKLFDYCLAIILTEDFILNEMWVISHDIICKYTRDTTRGFQRLVLDGKLLKEIGVKRIF